ncbi:MAG: hypothetical protein Q9174_005247 [Haloplaca sp. 1 TL-2023]
MVGDEKKVIIGCLIDKAPGLKSVLVCLLGFEGKGHGTIITIAVDGTGQGLETLHHDHLHAIWSIQGMRRVAVSTTGRRRTSGTTIDQLSLGAQVKMGEIFGGSALDATGSLEVKDIDRFERCGRSGSKFLLQSRDHSWERGRNAHAKSK